MLRIDRTPIYEIFMKKAFFCCPVSGIYIPTPFLTGHHRTQENKKRVWSIMNRTPGKDKKHILINFAVWWCPVYD